MPVVRLGDAHLLRETCPLIEQPMDVLIDRVDAAAHILEPVRPSRRGGRGRRRGAGRLPRKAATGSGSGRAPKHGFQRIRAESTPSIARMRASSSAPSMPSASMSVYAYSPRDLLSRSAMLMFWAARQVEICPTMLGTLRFATPRRVVFGTRGNTASG